MLQLKIGVHLPSLCVPFRQALTLAAKMGVDAVEIDAQLNLRPQELSQTALRPLRKSLDDYRLRMCAISFRTRHGYGELDQLDARVVRTKEVMRMAHALGTAIVVVHVGHIPPKPEGPQWNLLREVLSDLGRHGQHVGAMLAAQTMGATGADFARLIAALPDGSLGIDLDPGQLVLSGSDSAEAVELLAPHVLHVHATDGVRDLTRRQNIEVPLGRGSVDWPALLGALEQRGYRGYFTVQRDSANPEVEIAQAVQYLRSL